MIEHQFASVRYRLPLSIEQMEDGSYLATSPALNGFLVLADSVEEVYQLAPDIAKTLLEAMRDRGLNPPIALEEIQFPLNTEVLVA
jgi:predicted RNase H-like HicB family nuclease